MSSISHFAASRVIVPYQFSCESEPNGESPVGERADTRTALAIVEYDPVAPTRAKTMKNAALPHPRPALG